MVALAAADTAAAAAAAATAAAVHPGVINLFNLSPAMARLCHCCAAKCRERCESRGEDLHRRCTYHPFLRFRHHRRPRRRRRRRRRFHHLRHPWHCIPLGSPPLELTAPSPPSLAATHRPPLDLRHVASRRGDGLPVATHRLHVTALLTPRRRG